GEDHSIQPDRPVREGRVGRHAGYDSLGGLDQHGLLEGLARPGPVTEEHFHVTLGRSRPRSAATWRARSYPASAWRITPVPGSLVRTSSRRRSAWAVPSATTWAPAWMELPIPTPPPWWTATQAAPEAVFRRALRIGQSATASEPSAIASVSR